MVFLPFIPVVHITEKIVDVQMRGELGKVRKTNGFEGTLSLHHAKLDHIPAYGIYIPPCGICIP